MTWIYVIAPLVAVILVYFGGKSAGRKEAELKQKIKEQKESENTDGIIANNNNLTDSDFNSWLQERAKK